MTQQRQHAVIRMCATLRLSSNYCNKTPETGTITKYDINTLREEPRSLEKWFTDTEQRGKEIYRWAQLKTALQTGLQKRYHVTNKTTHRPEIDNLDKQSADNKWGTEEEKTNMGQK